MTRTFSKFYPEYYCGCEVRERNVRKAIELIGPTQVSFEGANNIHLWRKIVCCETKGVNSVLAATRENEAISRVACSEIEVD
jgi:hypothetical protein